MRHTHTDLYENKGLGMVHAPQSCVCQSLNKVPKQLYFAEKIIHLALSGVHNITGKWLKNDTFFGKIDDLS